MLILALHSMPYHAVVVFTSGYDFLFKSSLGHCDWFAMQSCEKMDGLTLKSQNQLRLWLTMRQSLYKVVSIVKVCNYNTETL